MSDRKTAAELRERAATVNVGVWAELYRHLAAVEEEEREAVMSLKTALVARQELDAVVAERDAATARAEAAEQARRSWEASSMRDYERANYHARLAADALRIGLEECERLRAERVSLERAWSRLTDENYRLNNELEDMEAQRDAASKLFEEALHLCHKCGVEMGDREKVGEWWEVRPGVPGGRCIDGMRFASRGEAKRYVCAHGQNGYWRVVHVTRWRKKR